MVMIKLHLCIYLFFIFLTYKSSTVYSIQCCVGDSSCSSKPVDCPSNVCFKIVFTKVAEERGCMGDLEKLLEFKQVAGRYPNDDSGSLNEQCKNLDGTGMSLCRCTRDLCNSASKYFYFPWPVYIFIIFVVYQFPSAFLS